MMVIKQGKKGVVSLPAKEIDFSDVFAFHSKIAQRIIKELSEGPNYPMNIAKKLGINEQKIYYHIRKLEKAKIIKVVKTEIVQGATTNFYEIIQPAFVLRCRDFFEMQKISDISSKPKEFIEPFIEDGKLNSIIVVGSPDPHGPEKARSRDGYYGIDLALFLGTFLNYTPSLNVKLDTEIREDELKENLILMGGPVVNMVSAKINQRCPIRFEKENNWCVKSTLSNKVYYADEIGVIEKIKNPFNPKKSILLIAGKRHSGTRAVIIAFLRHFDSIMLGNKYKPNVLAKVVEGEDLDSDGIVDNISVLE